MSYHPSFPVMTKNFLLQGPVGDLELAISIPEINKKKAVAIICHPHPLYQGTMDNKVVMTFMRAYNALRKLLFQY